jgi:hypothetical protein
VSASASLDDIALYYRKNSSFTGKALYFSVNLSSSITSISSHPILFRDHHDEASSLSNLVNMQIMLKCPIILHCQHLELT